MAAGFLEPSAGDSDRYGCADAAIGQADAVSARREVGLNKFTLARKPSLEGEVRRMLDLDPRTSIGTLEKHCGTWETDGA
jgi:hypothetical protein